MKNLYSLPKKVIFCKLCVNSNQRPCSYPEFHHDRERKNANYLNINNEGICDACNVMPKNKINWKKREKNF